MNRKKSAIVVAGGTGSRMNSPLPKQFIPLHGKPLLLYSLEILADYDPDMEIVLVLPSDFKGMWEQICNDYSFARPVRITSGGRTRFHSVSAGLSALPLEESLVAVHDAVRPFINHSLLNRLFETAGKEGCAIPVYPVQDSLREKKEDGSIAVNRENFITVQTPQCFRSELLKTAYLQTIRNSFTDDASVYESAGGIIHTIEGEKWNIKITGPEDLLLAEALIENKTGKPA